ncbi:MAG: hypothetical protein RR253_01745, partial [Oscillospiraceae bacterium]
NRFILIDDNSTTGRTFTGLKMFIEEHGGTVVDTYAPTVGQDMAEKMTTTDETWAELERYGIENIKAFAQQQGIKREITQKGLSEYEGRTLWQKYEKYNAQNGNRRADERSLLSRGSQLKGSSGNPEEVGRRGQGEERQRQIIKDT